MKVFAMLLLALVMGGHVSPANADPVNDHDPDMWVYRIAPGPGDTLKIKMSDGYRVTLNPCRYEDGRRCYWNGGERGNGHGKSFVVVRGIRYYIEVM